MTWLQRSALAKIEAAKMLAHEFIVVIVIFHHQFRLFGHYIFIAFGLPCIGGEISIDAAKMFFHEFIVVIVIMLGKWTAAWICRRWTNTVCDGDYMTGHACSSLIFVAVCECVPIAV